MTAHTMDRPSLGARLRAQRERQRITLTAIADQTKIKASLLEGLERDDLARWPAGIFRRGYVRSYAKAIGLDPEHVLKQFLDMYPEPVDPSPDEELAHGGVRSLFGRFRGDEWNGGQQPRDTASHRPAGLCTRLGRAAERAEIATVLQESVRILNAVGVILWIWVSRRQALVGVVAQGYPEQLLAQLPAVSGDADNAVGTAFRSAQTQIVVGSASATGAVVAPLMTPGGCAGVLAIELQPGSERCETTRGFAMILAAQLAALIAVPVDDSQIAEIPATGV
jgi:hypothetical protein